MLWLATKYLECKYVEYSYAINNNSNLKHLNGHVSPQSLTSFIRDNHKMDVINEWGELMQNHTF